MITGLRFVDCRLCHELPKEKLSFYGLCERCSGRFGYWKARGYHTRYHRAFESLAKEMQANVGRRRLTDKEHDIIQMGAEQLARSDEPEEVRFNRYLVYLVKVRPKWFMKK